MGKEKDFIALLHYIKEKDNLQAILVRLFKWSKSFRIIFRQREFNLYASNQTVILLLWTRRMRLL